MPAVRQPKPPPVGNSSTCPKSDKPMRVVRATPAMLDALNRAERCRDLAEECRRLAATSLSAQMRNRYSRMAEHYSTLAEAEEHGHISIRRSAASIAPT
jgi:hypothetical protein